MGLAQNHGLAERGAVRIKREAIFGTFVQPTASPSCGALFENFTVDKKNEQIVNMDWNEYSADPHETIQGMTRATWTGRAKFRPNGTVGELPDIDPFLKLVFGGKQIVRSITILDYSVGAGDAVTLTFKRASGPLVGTQVSVLTEGVDWLMGASNTAARDSLRTAIAALVGIVTATAVGGAQILLATAQDVDSLTIAISDPALASTVGVYVSYFGSVDQGARGSATIARRDPTSMDAAVGAWANKLTLAGANGTPPTMAFDGGAKDVVTTTAGTVLDSTVSATQFTVDVVDVEVNSVIQFRTTAGVIKSNSGAGFRVTTVLGSTITVDAPHGAVDTDTIEPFVPAYTPTGLASPGVKGSFTLGGETVEVLSWSIDHGTGNAPNEAAFNATATDVLDGDRVTTAKITIRARADQVRWIQRYRGDSSTTYALVLSIGTLPNYITRITLGKVFVVDAPTTIPDKGQIDVTLTVQALASVRTANDAIEMRWGLAA